VSRTYISDELRHQVRQDAGERCGYCQASELVTATELVVDHIRPRSAGGPTARENLWLICTRCNQFKGDKVDVIDPQTGNQVLLFNPRTQVWNEHFAWSEDGTEVMGRTACGRATIEALHLNRKLLVLVRRRWASVGWHPPAE
jgi:hypothetical protein